MVEVSGLGQRFGSAAWVFRNVSFTVAPRESVVVLGPSGSGKSVLLKTLAGLIAPTEGSVRLGTPNLGMLFQKNALFDSLTVEENLLFPMRERLGIEGKVARTRARGYLQAVGLAGNEALYPDEISGGMQKRLGIARALAVEPELLFYDEPTAGLDPITSRTIAELIQSLRAERGTTLVTVTNDIQRAYQLADRIFLLAQGGLHPGGTPDEVRHSKDPALKQFIYGLREGPLTSGLA